MERVYSCENPLIAQHIKNLLVNSEIDCFLKNEAVQSLAGEVPPIVTWPEVWIVNPADKQKAEALIQSMDSLESSDQEEWKCGNCNEVNDGNFNICWNCNESKS